MVLTTNGFGIHISVKRLKCFLFGRTAARYKLIPQYLNIISHVSATLYLYAVWITARYGSELFARTSDVRIKILVIVILNKKKTLSFYPHVL